jgi:proline-specific peptidase
MSAPPTIEAEVPFDAPGAGKPCKTWYKMVGSLADAAGPPLIALHGGPGAGHGYMTSLTDLWTTYGIPVIFYDQVGCGRSTNLREKAGDVKLWTFDLYIRELDNLIDHLKLRDKGFYLLGQSWGGMVSGQYACSRPKGLKALVIAGGPASIPLLAEGFKGLLAALPDDARQTLDACNEKGDYESEKFEKAAAVFYARHVCRLKDPKPDEIQSAFRNLKDDPTAYLAL